MTPRSLFLWAAACLAAPATFGGSAAAQQSQQLCPQSQTIPLSFTNWTNRLTFPRFDPEVGILAGVQISLGSEIEIAARFESLDAAPANVSILLTGNLTLYRPGGSSAILSSSPSQGFQESVTAFDGTIDFMGTSGRTYPAVTLTESLGTTFLPPSADMALFTGPAGNPGVISLPVTANGNSIASGAGNIVTQFSTRAGATVQVCYLYYPDCNGNGIPDYIDIQNGAPDRYGPGTCAPDGIPDSCQPEPDCDNDGLPNRCELFANDCDNNQFPDDCQPDCDDDGVADSCEILRGARDVYGPNTCVPDGIPDVCQPQPDCDNDGSPDRCEIANGTATDLDGNGVPDNCQPDCDNDGIPDAVEIAAGAPDRYGPKTCVPDGIPDSCQPQPDCDLDGQPDRCELAGNDCDNNHYPDNCQPDCDGDGVADACELINGTAADRYGATTCVADGIPDNCQPQPDCDGDGIPDRCEIAAGAPDRYGVTTCTPDGIPDNCQPQPDCDGDGIPDRCEILAGAFDRYGATTCVPDGIPDSCQPQPDCDNDGIPDRCEIAGGAADQYGATTCVPDGIPDSCQPQTDCDSDGTPDRCEIAGGAPDTYGPNSCSPDGIPDLCQPQPDCDNDGSPDRCEVDTDGDGIPDDCDQGGTNGCTPGYWKNHPEDWPVTGYATTMDFDAVFGVNAFTPNLTLMQALRQGGGGIIALGRHAVAALLSSTHPGVAYPIGPNEVITLVRNAVLSGDYEPVHLLLASYNEQNCPL